MNFYFFNDKKLRMSKSFDWKYNELLGLNNGSELSIRNYKNNKLIIDFIEEYEEDDEKLELINNIVKYKGSQLLLDESILVLEPTGLDHVIYNMDIKYINDTTRHNIYNIINNRDYNIIEALLYISRTYKYVGDKYLAERFAYLINNGLNFNILDHIDDDSRFYFIFIETILYLDNITNEQFAYILFNFDVKLDDIKMVINNGNYNMDNFNYRLLSDLCRCNRRHSDRYNVFKYLIEEQNVSLVNNNYHIKKIEKGISFSNSIIDQLIVGETLTLDLLILLCGYNINIPEDILHKLFSYKCYLKNIDLIEWVLDNIDVDINIIGNIESNYYDSSVLYKLNNIDIIDDNNKKILEELLLKYGAEYNTLFDDIRNIISSIQDSLNSIWDIISSNKNNINL